MNNILLIDDNREIHNSLRPIAAAHGYSLLSAYDGLSGLSMAQSCGADIIILDVMLPQSNGFALCRKIREAGCDTRLYSSRRKAISSTRASASKPEAMTT